MSKIWKIWVSVFWTPRVVRGGLPSRNAAACVDRWKVDARRLQWSASRALHPPHWSQRGGGILGVRPDVLRPLLLVCIRLGTYRPGISATVETIRYVETSAK